MSDTLKTPPPKKQESRILSHLRGYFLTGIVVTAPVGLSLYIVWSILLWIDDKVGDIIPIHLSNNQDVPGLGVIVAFCFFVVVGWFARNYFGRLFLKISDYIMERLPFVRTIYGALKQVFEMVMGQQAQAFREVVLVEFPQNGQWIMGFLTGSTEGEIQNKLGRDLVNVVIPMTPNPTSAFLMFIEREKIIRLNMSVDEGIKMLISCGMITPKWAKDHGVLPISEA